MAEFRNRPNSGVAKFADSSGCRRIFVQPASAAKNEFVDATNSSSGIMSALLFHISLIILVEITEIYHWNYSAVGLVRHLCEKDYDDFEIWSRGHTWWTFADKQPKLYAYSLFLSVVIHLAYGYVHKAVIR